MWRNSGAISALIDPRFCRTTVLTSVYEVHEGSSGGSGPKFHHLREILRHLGIGLTGGAHSHIKQRIVAFGLDTSHFTGRGHSIGRSQRSPDQILVVRAVGRKRAPGSMLTRALRAVGRTHACAACGIGALWEGQTLVLQVDHINGDYHDCRSENLGFLCPNCHSQTRTFAGRGKRPSLARPASMPPSSRPEPIMAPLTLLQAAQLLGCSPGHFYRIRKRFRGVGPAGTHGSASKLDGRAARDAAILACALENPNDGPKKIAARLADYGEDIRPSHGTVSNVLRAAGLSTAQARRDARNRLGESTGNP